ncbi:MAG: HU family DNA-binding protein [Chloroflexota bacterium]
MMNHRQTVAEISKRLPRLKRRDVAEVLEIMTELWLEELAQPGQTITVADLGKLTVEVQTVRSGGAVGRRILKRVYVRFRPTEKFRQSVLDAHIKERAVK